LEHVTNRQFIDDITVEKNPASNEFLNRTTVDRSRFHQWKVISRQNSSNKKQVHLVDTFFFQRKNKWLKYLLQHGKKYWFLLNIENMWILF